MSSKSTPTNADPHGRDVERVQSADEAKAEQEAAKEDPNIVDWDGPDDSANPQNWSDRKKWANVGVLAAITFFGPFASSVFAPGVPEVQQQFNNDDSTLATFVVSAFLLGYVAGPLVLVPLADMFGRVPIYHAGNVGFVVFTVACAVSSNFNMLIGFRFLAGLVGSAPMTVGGGTIADIMPPQKRGLAIMVWSMPVVAGPAIAPVIGGFLAQAKGWRWLFWLTAIAAGAAAVAGVFVMCESNPSVILRRKAKRLQNETGNLKLRSKLDLDMNLSTRDLFVRAIVRPTKLLFLSPICGLCCLYNAFIYSLLYLFFTTYTFLFGVDYGFSPGLVGLTYIGAGIGMMAGMVLYGVTSDKIAQHLVRKYGVERPEYRLPLCILATPFVPIGLFIYGWTAEFHMHWAVPLLGTLLVGFGFVIIMSSIANYLIDTFNIYAASAMGALTISRSIFAATFPLFALHMYDSLGWGWGNSLLGFIALVGCAIPPLFWSYGEAMRTNPKFQVNL